MQESKCNISKFIISDLAKEKAQGIADQLEDNIGIEINAIAINHQNGKYWNIEGYFSNQEYNKKIIAKLLRQAVNQNNIKIEFTNIEQKDWVTESLKNLPPVSAGIFYIYGSHDKTTTKENMFNIEVDAGQAFGTGHHGTTIGCLEAIDFLRKIISPKKSLDIGCGTGILAIAAAKAFKQKVIASDIDPIATKVTIENSKLNEVSPFITAITANGTLTPVITDNAPYDLIIVNILAKPLLSISGDINKILQINGYLILSGITTDQEQRIINRYNNIGIFPVMTIRKTEWSTIIMRNQLYTV